MLVALQSDPANGLAGAEAQRRLTTYGPNERNPNRPCRWRRFLAQFTDPLVLLLLAATIISIIAWLSKEPPGCYEALAIIAIVIVNALIGFFQEERAEEAVEALKR